MATITWNQIASIVDREIAANTQRMIDSQSVCKRPKILVAVESGSPQEVNEGWTNRAKKEKENAS